MQQWRTVWAIGWVSVVNAVILSEYHAPSYKFTAVNIDDLLRDDENFIGHVVEVTDSDNIKFWCRAVYSSWHLVCLNLCREKFNSASCPSVVDTYHISYKWNSFTTTYIRGYHSVVSGAVKVSAGTSSRDGQTTQGTSSQQLQQGDTVETIRQKYLRSGNAHYNILSGS